MDVVPTERIPRARQQQSSSSSNRANFSPYPAKTKNQTEQWHKSLPKIVERVALFCPSIYHFPPSAETVYYVLYDDKYSFLESCLCFSRGPDFVTNATMVVVVFFFPPRLSDCGRGSSKAREIDIWGAAAGSLVFLH